MTITTCIFDAYGTLFDVAAAARLAAEEPGQDDWAAKWPALAADWRAKQLQYTWLRAITGEHCDFWQVTRDGLDWALERQELDGNPELRERLLALYWELQAYPEVPEMLAALKSVNFTDMCIVSDLALTADPAPNEAFRMSEAPGLGVVFELAEGQKCQRCWKILPDVGSHSHPGVCARCDEVLSHG